MSNDWQPSRQALVLQAQRVFTDAHRCTLMSEDLPAMRGTARLDTAILDCVADVHLHWRSCWQAENVLRPSLCPLALQVHCSFLVAPLQAAETGASDLPIFLFRRVCV